MLSLLSSSFYTFFFFPLFFPLEAVFHRRTGSVQIINSAHMSRYCHLFGATKVKDAPYRHPWIYTRCAQSHGLN
jgi:hypothetical protein